MLLVATPGATPSNNFYAQRCGLKQIAIQPTALFTIAHCYALGHQTSWPRWRATGENNREPVFPRDVTNSADRKVPMTVKGRGQPTQLPARALRRRALAGRPAITACDFAGGAAAPPTDDHWPQGPTPPWRRPTSRLAPRVYGDLFDAGVVAATDDHESMRAALRRRPIPARRAPGMTAADGDDEGTPARLPPARTKRLASRRAIGGDLEPFGGSGGQEIAPPVFALSARRRARFMPAQPVDRDQPAAPAADDHDLWRVLARVLRPRRRVPLATLGDTDQPAAPVTDDHDPWRWWSRAVRPRRRPALAVATDVGTIDDAAITRRPALRSSSRRNVTPPPAAATADEEPPAGTLLRIWWRLRRWWPFGGGDIDGPSPSQPLGPFHRIVVAEEIRAGEIDQATTVPVAAEARQNEVDGATRITIAREGKTRL